ncbi:hypothetical protein IMZ08_17540 [Bacillus luteolus]|uniref:Nuclear transport factor 2 family protein n=1 Tax=Litchfieldia luteola TaxID=682179 RepID=A0ABR9QN57_9BACI|nr:hypothetical protein [Cytobacillus luteolus]MBE4909841.1 hypothetical protein [Cytobacillus luteolus]MBP1942610.1 hypothetical protein [Cytobacillus luteolus]
MVLLKESISEFTMMHDEFISDWNLAMISGDTTKLERMAEDYYVAFFDGAKDKPVFYNKEDALAGMKQSVLHFQGANKRFENRVIRLKDNENAVVFYEQLIVKKEEVLARLFTIEYWQLSNEKWMIIRETEERIN